MINIALLIIFGLELVALFFHHREPIFPCIPFPLERASR